MYLGGWFLYQFFEGNYALVRPTGGSGVAFFAHVGGFVFGVVVARVLLGAGPVDTIIRRLASHYELW